MLSRLAASSLSLNWPDSTPSMASLILCCCWIAFLLIGRVMTVCGGKEWQFLQYFHGAKFDYSRFPTIFALYPEYIMQVFLLIIPTVCGTWTRPPLKFATYESYDISSLGEPIVVIHVIRLDYMSVLPAAQYFVHAPFASATASRAVARKIFRWSPSRGAYCSNIYW